VQKPGQLQAVAVYTLIVGILNILWGCGWMFFGFCLFGFIPGIYSIVCGILEIIYATKILPTPIRPTKPATYIAIMEIVNIISFSVLSLVAGILSLTFYNDDRVKAYFDFMSNPAAYYTANPPAPGA